VSLCVSITIPSSLAGAGVPGGHVCVGMRARRTWVRRGMPAARAGPLSSSSMYASSPLRSVSTEALTGHSWWEGYHRPLCGESKRTLGQVEGGPCAMNSTGRGPPWMCARSAPTPTRAQLRRRRVRIPQGGLIVEAWSSCWAGVPSLVRTRTLPWGAHSRTCCFVCTTYFCLRRRSLAQDHTPTRYPIRPNPFRAGREY
jgi:hypothetical protein